MSAIPPAPNALTASRTSRLRWVQRRGAAFSLVELLVVMAIIILLLGLAVPAVTTLSKSTGLNNGGRLFSNLLTIARSEAINQRTIVRVEVAAAWPPDPSQAYHKATLTAAKYDATNNKYIYRQLSAWETLPDGIIIENNNVLATDGSLYFTDDAYSSNNARNNSTDPLTFGNDPTPISTIYIAFQPNGALSLGSASPVPVRARLVEGVMPATGANISYTHTAVDPNTGRRVPANWFDVRANALTGRIDIGRPEAPLQ